MRRPAPDARPVALTVAGSDSGGGAGIQADLQSMAAHGVFGTSAVTAVTAQNTRGVDSAHVLPLEEIEAQIEAVLGDFDVAAAKTGMLATAPVVDLVAERVADADVPVVVDPVMVAASGDRLLDADAERAYEGLIADATLVTPNADEAEVLTGVAVEDDASAREAGEAIRELGADAALVKGGHVPGDAVRDVLVAADGVEIFEHPRVETDATHGSGCTLSASIAARLARGEALADAVEAATAYMERAVRYHYDVGEGPGAVNHLVGLRNDAAREPTAEAVREAVDRLADVDVAAVIREGGTTVVGATPWAETVEEVAAVEGGLARTPSGVRPNGDVRFGASDDVARTLLAAREAFPDRRFAADLRAGGDVRRAVDALGWDVAAADEALSDRAAPPVAVFDRDGDGDAGTATLLAREAGTLVERTLALSDRVR
ncbi:bifunctional hydroxymethylpyrimidine kinase/phosphomethylpyrimidine kinase [Salinilacihabitans rarus]|uniref:bifunctional hydroxymethylpyrimidine kinase/phosphomethylpyrimidine kinase n=1 Tax=Salinilacihabitans rarus TaxID=2961596 RepID=UPI0020C90732|nr:bifunctional hydroxymethylpyrimidine kinase/phosphomethylpyrimidine kinase [Salinilacihabitans rarus]